ncbi:MAG TPA: efflux RND transporter permease subunit [Thermoanaerobaculaceae bacterium]|nr:efflux RND transporter permease subunit [Thermoanaerobaculaceae bacterium]
MFLSNLSIKRPVVATVMILTLVTLGLFSFRRLAIDMMPDVEYPVLAIMTEFPGASPETVEREVSRRIEEAVNPIAGVKHVDSVSREGLSSVIVEFNLEVKINDVSQEARAKINGIRRELPDGMKEPVIQKFDANSLPIVSLAVRSSVLNARDLTTLADRKIKRRLENLQGVAKAKLIGSSKREIAVELDPARLQALGMGVDEVVAGLQAENVNTPLGRLTGGASEMPLRVSGKPKQVDGYAGMVIAQRAGQPVALGDVARVVDTVEEQRSLALINGEPAVALDITKQTKANTVEVVDAVKKAVEGLRQEMPAGTEIQVVRDNSVFIRDAVSDVQSTLLLGGLLTILIVFCFLNSWRSTVITGLTLPISVISSFIVMYFLNMTLNMLTLMALSLAIGLLIDDAIVVRENIVRHLEKGEDHFTAAREGTSEIGLAVLATSMSIIAVFVPVAFMKGIVGRFFFQFGLTVAFAVLVSLFVSFTLDPMLSSRWHDPDIERAGARNFVQRGLDRFNAAFERTADAYKRLIGWALDHRKTVLAVAMLAFAGGLGIFAALQTEFMTPMDQGEFMVKFKSAPGASFAETKGRLGEALRALGEFKEVRYTYASIAAGDNDTVRDAMIFVKLSDKSERKLGLRKLVSLVRRRLERIPGLVLSVQEEADAYQKPLQVALRGDDITTLKRYAGEIKRELAGVPGIVDLEASLEQDLPEYRLAVDRERAAATGLGSGAIAGTLGVLVGGQAVSTYEDDSGESIDVRLRLPGELRRDVGQVGDLRLSVPGAGAAALVPLADLVTFTRATSPAEINRRDLARQVVIDANLDNLPLGTAGERAMAAASHVKLAPGYRLVMGGDTEIMVESFGYLAEALLLAVIFVYLILAAQFESFIDPLAIMLSLPLSIVGMAGMLLVTGDTISIMSLIGLIMLMGLVTKNAILLIDYTKVLRGQGMDRRTALVTAGRTRLRPIMMTTSAMIFGMLPLFFALGKGAEFRAPMARAVVGGLITSTLLTLVVVPVVYSILDDLAAWLHRRLAGAKAELPAAARAAATALLLAALAGSLAVRPAFAQATPAAPPDDPAATSESRTPDPGPRVLTLDQALAIAAAKNLDVKKAEEYRRWLDARYVEERAAAFPHLALNGSVMRTYDDSPQDFYKGFPPEFQALVAFQQDVRSASVNLSQAVFTWGQVGAAIRGAKWALATGDDQLRRFQQAVRRDVTAAFYDVLLAKEFAAIAAQTVDQRQRHFDETQRRYALGTATDYDVLAAQVALANARPDAIRGDNAVRTARERLRFLLAEEGEVDATGTLATEIGVAPDYAAVLADALAHRPELAQSDHTRRAQLELVRINGANDRPRLDLQASYGLRNLDVLGESSRGKTWNAGLVLSFPFFDGLKTRAKVAQARSDLRTSELAEAQLRDSIALEVRTAVDSVAESAEIMRALASTVAQAEKLMTMAEKGYEFGVKTRLEVDDAQLNLQSARANLTRAERDYRVALVTLQWVAGTLGDAPTS